MDIVVFSRLIRVKQWIKNLFVLAPMAFAGRFLDPVSLVIAGKAFLSFCLISSGVYIFNDLVDRHRDALHPKKRLRPLASGEVSVASAVILTAVFVLGGMSLAFSLGYEFVFLHGLYNFAGKKIVLVDVGCIALGFCLRVWAGAVAVSIVPTVWLQMCVFLLALFLGFTKRRSEMVALQEKSEEHREVLRHYSLYFLDQLILISATLVIVFYGLYTISPDIVARAHGYGMVYSLGFVIYGMFRYLYLVHVKKAGDDPGEILTGDLPMLLAVTVWILYVGSILYFFNGWLAC